MLVNLFCNKLGTVEDFQCTSNKDKLNEVLDLTAKRSRQLRKLKTQIL
jgi:hypothetical protein